MEKKRPSRPITGGTNNGTRPIRYDYWRTGYGENPPPELDFYLVQAGEYHCKPNYITGSFEHPQETQFFYHIGGKAFLEDGRRSVAVTRGDLFIIPPNHTFAYKSDRGMKHHWFAMGGTWPGMLGEPEKKIFSLDYDDEIESLFIEIREILILRKLGYLLRAIGVFYELMARVEEISKPSTIPESTYPDAVRNAIILLRENYHLPFNAAQTAAAVGLSQSHLRALFEKWLGESPKRFHTGCRIDQAKRLLSSQRLSVAEVAYHVGFSDVHHFSRVFKQTAGVAPSQYAQRQG